jgi:hypothetical protein
MSTSLQAHSINETARIGRLRRASAFIVTRRRLSNAQTARVYDAGVQNRRAPQTICSCDPRRSLLFRCIVGMELRYRRHGTHDPFADAAFSCRSIGDCTSGSDAAAAARLQFGRIKFHARDRPYDQCSRRRGPEKGHGIWSAMIDFRCLCYRERLDEPKAAESTNFHALLCSRLGV